jgi:hypothetical protein
MVTWIYHNIFNPHVSVSPEDFRDQVTAWVTERGQAMDETQRESLIDALVHAHVEARELYDSVVTGRF